MILRSEMSGQVPPAFDLSDYLDRRVKWIDQGLDQCLPPAETKPKTLHESMRYSIFAGGKRLRPILCLAAAESCCGKIETALPLACAVECIHTYSLIHDDLPAMDNDDLRRGHPTNHVVYGEGIAILAGDALLTHAFALAAESEKNSRYNHQSFVYELASAAGSIGLIAGQVADLEGEGQALSEANLKYIHERKTSALLCCSVRLGGMSANCTQDELSALTDFGYHIGLAFQVIDDILDVTQSSKQLGKTAGKDEAANKATFPSIVGMEQSQIIAEQWTKRALNALKGFPPKRSAALCALAKHLLARDH